MKISLKDPIELTSIETPIVMEGSKKSKGKKGYVEKIKYFFLALKYNVFGLENFNDTSLDEFISALNEKDIYYNEKSKEIANSIIKELSYSEKEIDSLVNPTETDIDKLEKASKSILGGLILRKIKNEFDKTDNKEALDAALIEKEYRNANALLGKEVTGIQDESYVDPQKKEIEELVQEITMPIQEETIEPISEIVESIQEVEMPILEEVVESIPELTVPIQEETIEPISEIVAPIQEVEIPIQEEVVESMPELTMPIQEETIEPIPEIVESIQEVEVPIPEEITVPLLEEAIEPIQEETIEPIPEIVVSIQEEPIIEETKIEIPSGESSDTIEEQPIILVTDKHEDNLLSIKTAYASILTPEVQKLLEEILKEDDRFNDEMIKAFSDFTVSKVAGTFADLATENKFTNEKNQKLCQKNYDLQKQNEKLKERNNELEERNNNLRTEMDRAILANIDLTSKYDRYNFSGESKQR